MCRIEVVKTKKEETKHFSIHRMFIFFPDEENTATGEE
jgi:hypothetical protein